MAQSNPNKGASSENAAPQAQPEDVPKPEAPPSDPNAVAPEVVKTTASGRKYGWQTPAKRIDPNNPETCAHTGLVAARAGLMLTQRDVGDEWVCRCDTVFVVAIGGGGNKIMVKKEDASGE